MFSAGKLRAVVPWPAVVLFVLSTLIAGYNYVSASADEEVYSPPPETQNVDTGELNGPFRPNIRIEVNIPATQMTIYENDEVVFIKPVAIGQRVYPTPEQESAIKRIEWNPWWYPPDSGWAAGASDTPPGPSNPLGRVKMPISDAILFHGTSKESTVGTPASHGCMRMYNKDVIEVAWFLQSRLSDKGDESYRQLYDKNMRTTYVVHLDEEVPVKLIYDPVIVKHGTLFLYPDYYGRLGHNRDDEILNAISESGFNMDRIDRVKIDEIVRSWPRSTTEIPLESLTIQ